MVCHGQETTTIVRRYCWGNGQLLLQACHTIGTELITTSWSCYGDKQSLTSARDQVTFFLDGQIVWYSSCRQASDGSAGHDYWCCDIRLATDIEGPDRPSPRSK